MFSESEVSPTIHRSDEALELPHALGMGMSIIGGMVIILMTVRGG